MAKPKTPAITLIHENGAIRRVRVEAGEFETAHATPIISPDGRKAVQMILIVDDYTVEKSEAAAPSA